MTNSTNCSAEAANTIKRTVTALWFIDIPVNGHSNAVSWAAPLAAMASTPNPLETRIRDIMNAHGSAAGPIVYILKGFFLER